MSDYVLILGVEVKSFGDGFTRIAASAWQIFVLELQWGLEPKGRLSYPLAVDLRVLNYVLLYSGP